MKKQLTNITTIYFIYVVLIDREAQIVEHEQQAKRALHLNKVLSIKHVLNLLNNDGSLFSMPHEKMRTNSTSKLFRFHFLFKNVHLF